MKALLNDLVDFNRTKLGLGINITLANVDLGAVFGDEVEQLRGAHPGRRLQLEVVGDQMRLLVGVYEKKRLIFLAKVTYVAAKLSLADHLAKGPRGADELADWITGQC